jgi:hypothetical protein
VGSTDHFRDPVRLDRITIVTGSVRDPFFLVLEKEWRQFLLPLKPFLEHGNPLADNSLCEEQARINSALKVERNIFVSDVI